MLPYLILSYYPKLHRILNAKLSFDSQLLESLVKSIMTLALLAENLGCRD